MFILGYPDSQKIKETIDFNIGTLVICHRSDGRKTEPLLFVKSSRLCEYFCNRCGIKVFNFHGVLTVQHFSLSVSSNPESFIYCERKL